MTGTIKIAERRRHPRTHLQMNLRGIRLDPECCEPTDCLRMRDISRNGMGAQSDHPFYPGQHILLSLPILRGAGRRSVNARVVRCSRGREGYAIGLEFETASTGAWCGSGSASFAAA